MSQIRDMETEINGKTRLNLQEFCDMEQLYRILNNWSKSTGMATVIVDAEGNQISEDFGLTEFCKMVQSCETGKACCMSTMKSDLDGIYECPFGFWDFSIPIVLPDGQVLGKVLAGQALSVKQKETEILRKTAELGIDEKMVKDVLSRVHRKTEKEMQGAYELLRETLHFFIQNSYSIWMANNELIDFESARNNPSKIGYKGSLEYPVLYLGDEEYEWHEINVFIDTEEDGTRVANILGRDITEAHNEQEKNEKELRAAADKNQILSDITKTLYSYNATVNLNTGKYSLIIGTGMEEFIRYFSQTDDYEKACEFLLEKALPEYPEEMNRRFSLNALREQQNLRGHIGQMEYAAVTEKGTGWFEVNAFMSVDEDGNAIANILGRDVTEVHEAQERRENELKAVAAKDQILSNITKTLYSYNLTLNLDSGKYRYLVTSCFRSSIMSWRWQGSKVVNQLWMKRVGMPILLMLLYLRCLIHR